MKALKIKREKMGYTQGQLAEMIGTTQQTIARWEAGKAEPNLAALRDLAICLSTSVDSLIGKTPSLPDQSTNPLSWIHGDETGFWGHIGLRLPSADKTIWYPVTSQARKEVFRDAQVESEEEWVSFQTLNNKMIIFRVPEINAVTFLDEADDGVCNEDWEVSIDALEGWPEEIYRCLDYVVGDDPGTDGNFSDELKTYVTSLIKEKNFTDDQIRLMCHLTRLFYKDGSNRVFDLGPEQLAEIF